MHRKNVFFIVIALLTVLSLMPLAWVSADQAPAGKSQQLGPAFMVLEGTFEGGLSSSDACSICLPPATSGTLRLEVDWRSGSVSGHIEGSGAGSVTGEACDGDEGETFTGQGSETVEGPISGSLAAGSLNLIAQMHYVGTTICTDNCENTAVGGEYDYVEEVPMTGTLSEQGVAQGAYSWTDSPCSFSATWSAEAITIQYDQDGDGKLDEEDRCPTLPAATEDGCPEVIPDSDGDGLTDEVDACPQEYNTTADGCPPPVIDTDGDGISEEDDRCPGRVGDNNIGCPVEREVPGRLQREAAVELILGNTENLESIDGWSDLSPAQQSNLQRLFEALERLNQPPEQPETLEDFLAFILENTFSDTESEATAELTSPVVPTSTSQPPTATVHAESTAEGGDMATQNPEDFGAPGFSLADQVYQQEQERLRRKQEQELAVAQQLVRLQEERQTIIRIVNDERYRQKFGGTYDLYRGTRDLIVPLIKKGGEWLKWVEDPEAAAMAAVQAWEKEQIKQGVNQALRDEGILYGPEAEIMTMEDVAIKTYQFVEHAATVPSLIHYGYYQEVYQQAIDEGDSPSDAHSWAMDKLREMMRNPTEEYMNADLSRTTRAWSPNASHNDELFRVYDQSFQRLNSMSVNPGVSK